MQRQEDARLESKTRYCGISEENRDFGVGIVVSDHKTVGFYEVQ